MTKRPIIGQAVKVVWKDAILRSNETEKGLLIQTSYGVIDSIGPDELVIAHSENAIGRDDNLTIPRGMVKKIIRLADGAEIRKW